VEEVLVEVRTGSKRDAVLYSVGANAALGLRRTDADKRRAVKTLLNDDEWAAWSDNAMAKACAVSQPFVSGLRSITSNVISDGPTEKTFTTKYGTTASMNTTHIAKACGVSVSFVGDQRRAIYSPTIDSAPASASASVIYFPPGESMP
jgi:hypothetical protein